MPTLDKAKARVGEGHNKDQKKNKGRSVGFVVFYPGRRADCWRVVLLNLCLAAFAFSCFIRLSFPWKQVKLCRQTRARCRLY